MSTQSSSPSFSRPLSLPLSSDDLERINAHLRDLSPQQILEWGMSHLPNLYQTTAFGLTGLAATDMLAKLTSHPPPLIFINTLYHFPETLELLSEVEQKYGSKIHVIKPDGCDTVEEFEARHGPRLWEVADVVYDYVVKVEPAARAYAQLGVQSVITGRRASQGGDRSTLQPLEVDSVGVLKLNPFFSWSFRDVKAYIDENNVPRNKLLDQGYKSIGDWHSTSKSEDGEDERAGRWKGTQKTECGLHKDYFVMKRLMKERREKALRAKDEARGDDPAVDTVSASTISVNSSHENAIPILSQS